MPMPPMSIIDTEAIPLMIYRDICRLRINNAFIDNDQGTIETYCAHKRVYD